MQNEKTLNDIDHNDFTIEMRDRDHAVVLLPNFDYEAQLVAIKSLLQNHSQREKLLSEEISKVKKDAQQMSGIMRQRAIEERIEKLEESVYQDAAHSMAAVGMLAPFVESIFYQAFQKIKDYYNAHLPKQQNHPRWQYADKDKWDCHYIFKNGKRNKSLVEGILQLAKAVNMFLPEKIEFYLKALFTYRNKMFHNGFEWPNDERIRFARFLKENKYTSLFGTSETDGTPWIYYMTKAFISECIALIDQIIDAIGKYAKNSYLIIDRTAIKKPDYLN